MANTYTKGFYSLMAEAGLTSGKRFDLYLKDIVGYGNSQALKIDGFTFDQDMQLDFDYEQLQIENNLKVMATYTDKDSEAIPFGTKGFTSSKGVIPRQKARFLMDEDDYRKYLLSRQNFIMQGGTAKDKAMDVLFNGMGDIKSAHELSMTYQRDQMISNRGFTLDATNNPRGIKGLTFKSDVPDENVTTLTNNNRWFTNDDKSTQGSTSTPSKDIKKIIRDMKSKGYLDITIEVDELSFLQDMEHSDWQTQLGYIMNSSLRMNTDVAAADAQAVRIAADSSDDQLKAAFAKYTGCTVKFSQSLVGVETLKADKSGLERTGMRSFNANTYVFYPTGNVGTIKVVAPLMPDSSALYGSILGGKGIIKYEYDAKSMVQDWWSELTALCVPNIAPQMRYLITK